MANKTDKNPFTITTYVPINNISLFSKIGPRIKKK